VHTHKRWRAGGRRTKKTQEKRGSRAGAAETGRGFREKPAAEEGHGKPQKLITHINTLTPWTLLLMYFLPFRPRAASLVRHRRASERERERNFRRKNPLSAVDRIRIYTRTRVYVIYVVVVVAAAPSPPRTGAGQRRPDETPHRATAAARRNTRRH